MAAIGSPHCSPACQLWLVSVMRGTALKVVCGFCLRPHTTGILEVEAGCSWQSAVTLRPILSCCGVGASHPSVVLCTVSCSSRSQDDAKCLKVDWCC